MYDDTEENVEAFRLAMRELRAVRADEEPITFCFWEFNEALAKINFNRAAGKDNGQGEFVAKFGFYVRQRLLELFSDRARGGARPNLWQNLHTPLENTRSHMDQTFPPYYRDQYLTKDMIACFSQNSVLSLTGSLAIRLATELDTNVLRRCMFFAAPLSVRGACSAAKLDRGKVFDSTSHHAIIDSLLERGVGAALIVAILAENDEAFSACCSGWCGS